MSGLQAERDDLFEECKMASEENARLRYALNLIALCTYENYCLSDVVKIAKDVLKSPDVPERTDDEKI